MKKILLTLTLISGVSFISNAQIGNPDMETWSGNDLGTWFDLNQYIGFGVPQTVFQETTGVPSGTYAARLKTVNCQVCPSLLPGSTAADTIIPGLITQDGPYVGMPDSLVFYYKYVPSGVDTAIVNFSVSKAGVTQGDANFYLLAAPSWTRVALPVSYIGSAQTSDSLDIAFASSYINAPKIGSEFYIDNITLVGGPAGINDLANQVEVNVFPNPANSLLTIDVTSTRAKNFVVYDMAGKRITSFNLTDLTNTLDISSLDNGTYIYSVSDENGFALKQGKIQVVK